MIRLAERLDSFESKICKKCHRELSFENFYTDNRAKDGKYGVCIECVKRRRNNTESSLPANLDDEIIADVEWKIVQAFANRVLREGMVREATQLEEIKKYERRYLAKIRSRQWVDAAYREFKEDQEDSK